MCLPGGCCCTAAANSTSVRAILILESKKDDNPRRPELVGQRLVTRARFTSAPGRLINSRVDGDLRVLEVPNEAVVCGLILDIDDPPSEAT